MRDRAQGTLRRDEDQDQQGSEEYLASTLPQLVQFLNPYSRKVMPATMKRENRSPETRGTGGELPIIPGGEQTGSALKSDIATLWLR